MFTIDSSFQYHETLEREKTEANGSKIIWKIKIVRITRNILFECGFAKN
jgi:hypothetical protein